MKQNPQCLKITQKVASKFMTFWHFPPNSVQLKLTCLVTLFSRKLQVFKNETFSIIFKQRANPVLQNSSLFILRTAILKIERVATQ